MSGTYNKANSLGHISAALRLWRMPQSLPRSNVPVICGVSHNRGNVMSNIFRVFLSLYFLCALETAYAAEKFGIYEDSEWAVGISNESSGYAMGSCSKGFLLEIPKGSGTIELDINLKFIGQDVTETYTGTIQATLTGTTGGRSRKEYIESPDLCFDIKEVVVVKATGMVNGKKRDLIKEHKINQSGFVPLPIRVDANG